MNSFTEANDPLGVAADPLKLIGARPELFFTATDSDVSLTIWPGEHAGEAGSPPIPVQLSMLRRDDIEPHIVLFGLN